MKKLKDLLQIIEKEDIIYEEINVRFENSLGIYLNILGLPATIGISKCILNNRCKYISVLAEELGHHFTSLGNLTIESKNYSERLMKNKQEHKAKSWAANFLISDEDFIQALYDCISTPCDMCEHFNVTNEILEYKIASIIHDEVKYSNIRKKFMLREVPYNCCTI